MGTGGHLFIRSFHCFSMDRAREKLILDNKLLRILEHFRLAKVDYAKNIMRYTEIQRSIIISSLRELERYGFIEKYTNTSIKRTEAKLKRSAEVHKHHTYFQITRAGSIVLKTIDIPGYLDFLGEECIAMLKRKADRDLHDRKCDKMLKMGLLDRNMNLTELGNKVLREASRSRN